MDLAAIWNSYQTTQVAVYPSAGLTFPGWAQWDASNGGWSASQKLVAGDFSYDGLTDIAALWNEGGTITIAMRRSMGTYVDHSTWGPRQVPFQSDTRVLPGDFNGDGATDLAVIYKDEDWGPDDNWTPVARTSVVVLLSHYTGFGEATARWVMLSEWRRARLARREALTPSRERI